MTAFNTRSNDLDLDEHEGRLRFPLFAAAVGVSVATTILALMLLPLMLVPFAVDTSRFAGFGFFGLLVAVRYAIEHEVLKPKTFMALSVVNLLIPSVYIGVNSGVMLFPGLYRVVYWWMA